MKNIVQYERIFSSILVFITAIALAIQSMLGPGFFDIIKYHIGEQINQEALGMDWFNLFILAPICFFASILYFFNSFFAKYLIVLPPIQLLQIGPLQAVAQEWDNIKFVNSNSERFWWLYAFQIISGLILLLISFSNFKENRRLTIETQEKFIIGIGFCFEVISYSQIWISQLDHAISLKFSNPLQKISYENGRSLFWMIRIFDLGIGFPLTLISFYVLITRKARINRGFIFLCFGQEMIMMFAVLFMLFAGHIKRSMDQDPQAYLLVGPIFVLHVYSFWVILKNDLKNDGIALFIKKEEKF